jgi:hypothetical protein
MNARDAMTKFTYSVHVRNGNLEVLRFISPTVAPVPQGHSTPLRTIGEVKRFARSQVAFSGWDRGTQRAAREAISLLYAGCFEDDNSFSTMF